MNEPVRTATADLHVGYAFFVVTDWSGSCPDLRLAYVNGLVGSDFNGALILTGITDGPVTVTVQLLDTAPDSVELDDSDEVAEVSVESEDGELIAHDLAADPPPEFPNLAHAGPGTYRLRVHARGRDIAPHLNIQEPVENYLLSVWPAPEAPDVVYKQSDERGQEYRAARRPRP
ncbi:hypothetical protein AB0F91_46800 [Amycolatopsis sp. NPDC023774]|uniref:hypothetical protein n=1 Tax=Amycolatopsis sp. NPDC023774 TaxID=3155015 RepID=UPI0033C4A255